MTIDRRALMNAAWTIARRFAGNRETWAQRLSRALKSVWWEAKQNAARAAHAAAAAVARASQFATLTVADLRAAIESAEACDRLGHAGIEHLSAMRREAARRAA